ncbi:MAG: radical SAM protein [Planctomycetales bacterium]|nr:radical SAM protein [Planctomycetales bacterium]
MTDRVVFQQHSRRFAGNRFVYPVVSRRSGGVSVGVNLNPDKVCNFDCVYCQVDRRSETDQRFVEQPQLLDELRDVLDLCRSGLLFQAAPFDELDGSWRHLNDIAFSGDGEPTTYGNFDELMSLCAGVKRQLALDDVKMVLITNASMFHRPHVQAGLNVLDDNQGEIWAKLDAGTESYFQQVDRTKIRYQQVLDNLLWAAQTRPIVIQSLFMRLDGQPPKDEEIDAYVRRLRHIVECGGALRYVQVYTVARRPAESFVTPLSDDEVDRITARVRAAGIAAEPFYGVA